IQDEHFSERQMHGTRAVMVDFTETVHWLQECAVSVELWHRDILLLSVAQYVDHAEYLSCVGRALRSLDAYCQTYRIDRSTELELRATGLITQVPVLAQPSEVRAGGAPRNYAYIPSHWLAKPA